MRHAFASFVFAAGLVLLSGAPARAAVDSSAAAVPDADSPAVQAARAKMVSGDYAAAIGDLAAYVPGHPDDLAAARLLGDLYFRIPDFRSAERVWKAILARHADDRQTHNRMGSLYAAQDRTAEAIGEFEQSLPERTAFEGLVAQHIKRGDLAAFSEEYRTLVELTPFDLHALSYYANILRAQTRYREAQLYFDRIAALKPNDCGPLVDAGNNEIDLGKLDLAMQRLNACLRLDANDYSALVDAGEAAMERNDVAEATRLYGRALAVRPAGSEVLVDLGYLEDDKGNWKGAVLDYIRAMSANPLRSEAYIDLGYDYNEHQLYQLAEAVFLKGLSVAPQTGALHYMLAVTYNLQGKIVLARREYELAIASADARVVEAARAEMALLPQRG
jgi:tetratricopeptide (TPR) repeat protein